jgi:predicted acetyltransferase
MDFRRLTDEHQPTFQAFLTYAFDTEQGPQRSDTAENAPTRAGTQYGIVDDGALRSVCTHHDFTVSLRDEWVPMAGLADLTTMPEYRRQGYVRELIEESLETWRGNYPLAALWPFDYGYYEQFGWAMGCTMAEYTCSPEALAFARDASGTTRQVSPDDWERLQRVTETYAQEYDLIVRRDETWWRDRIFRSASGQDRTVYALERDDKIRGYLAYTSESADDGTRLRVLYNAFTDREAFRGLLGLLSTHEAREVVLYRPEETSLLDLAPDPKAVDCQIHPGMMVRVVDVADALEAISYPDDASGTLVVEVSDETASWNDGQFAVTVTDGAADCERVDTVSPDVRLDIGTLSQLFVGHHTVDEAREFGTLWVRAAEHATRVASWLPPRPVSPTDNF